MLTYSLALPGEEDTYFTTDFVKNVAQGSSIGFITGVTDSDGNTGIAATQSGTGEHTEEFAFTDSEGNFSAFQSSSGSASDFEVNGFTNTQGNENGVTQTNSNFSETSRFIDAEGSSYYSANFGENGSTSTQSGTAESVEGGGTGTDTSPPVTVTYNTSSSTSGSGSFSNTHSESSPVNQTYVSYVLSTITTTLFGGPFGGGVSSTQSDVISSSFYTATYYGTSSTSSTDTNHSASFTTSVSTSYIGGGTTETIDGSTFIVGGTTITFPGTIPTITTYSDAVTTTEAVASSVTYTKVITNPADLGPLTSDSVDSDGNPITITVTYTTYDTAVLTYTYTSNDPDDPFSSTVTQTLSSTYTGFNTDAVITLDRRAYTFAASEFMRYATVLYPEYTPEKNDWVYLFFPGGGVSDFAEGFRRFDGFFTSISDPITIEEPLDTVINIQPENIFTGQTGNYVASGTTYDPDSTTSTTGTTAGMSWNVTLCGISVSAGTGPALSNFVTTLTSYNNQTLPMESGTYLFGYQDWSTTDVDITEITSTADTASAAGPGIIITVPGNSVTFGTSTFLTVWITSDGGISWSVLTSQFTTTTTADPNTTIVGFNETESSVENITTAPLGTTDETFFSSHFHGETVSLLTPFAFNMNTLDFSLIQVSDIYTKGFQIQPYLASSDNINQGIDAISPIFYPEVGLGFPFLLQNECVAGANVKAFCGITYSKVVPYPQFSITQTLVTGNATFETPFLGSMTDEKKSYSFAWATDASGTDSTTDINKFSRFSFTTKSTHTDFNTAGSLVTITESSSFTDMAFLLGDPVTAIPTATSPVGPQQDANVSHIGGGHRGFTDPKTLIIKGCFDSTNTLNSGTELVPTITTTEIPTDDLRAVRQMSAFSCNTKDPSFIFTVLVFEQHYNTLQNNSDWPVY